jgi:hypothetical protein
MFILGHIGITVGVGLIVDFGLRKKYGSAIAGTSTVTGKANTTKKSATANPHLSNLAKSAVFMRHMDYRLLLLGSMLPDLIDKPLGHIFFADFFNNQGRLFAHSLLFLIIIISLGLGLYRRWGQQWLLILSFGTAVHLLLDEMWRAPGTVLWPFLGWGFEKEYAGGNWWTDIWNSFTEASPYVIATETIGVALLIVFLIVLVRRKSLYGFIRYGRL